MAYAHTYQETFESDGTTLSKVVQYRNGSSSDKRYVSTSYPDYLVALAEEDTPRILESITLSEATEEEEEDDSVAVVDQAQTYLSRSDQWGCRIAEDLYSLVQGTITELSTDTKSKIAYRELWRAIVDGTDTTTTLSDLSWPTFSDDE